MGRGEVRASAVDGSFYPAQQRQLSGIVESLIASVRPAPLDSPPKVLLVPHAGYPFSGQTAAYAYKSIKGRSYDTVVMVGPSHHIWPDGPALYSGDYWNTPLGDVAVDADLASKIQETCGAAYFNDDAHSREHSLEVQIPFLQKVLRDFKIVPIATLQKTADDARELASSIFECCKDREWLLLATSDLYHGSSYDECVDKSEITVESIMKGDPDEMERSFASGRSTACGEGAILTALSSAKLLDASPVLLHQTNSGDVMGSRTGYVVGYCSVAFT